MNLDPVSDTSSSSVTEAVAVGAVVGAASVSHHGPSHAACENCGAKLEGPYCHRCGQHDFEFHRSFRHVLLEALETWFHFEGKFFRNIVTLMFRPGRLTAEFNAGKRAVQMPPFRLYLFVSVFFFFVLFLTKAKDSAVVLDTSSGPSVTAAEGATAAVPVPAARRTASRPVALQLDGGDNSAFLGWIEEVGNKAVLPENRARLANEFLHSIPRLLLVCLPLFALYTRLLYWRAGQVYLQHLVVALHFHTFLFLWLLSRDGWVGLTELVSPTLGRVVWVACMAWLTAYPVLMLRHLFRNSWRRTMVKVLALITAYFVTFSFTFVGALLVMLAML